MYLLTTNVEERKSGYIVTRKYKLVDQITNYNKLLVELDENHPKWQQLDQFYQSETILNYQLNTAT
jgi:hypothetical protein